MRTLVRRINEWDGPTMLKVYAPYVQNSHCTKEKELPLLKDYINTIDLYTYGLGWIMSEIDGETVGFCHLRHNDYDPSNLFGAMIELYVKQGFERRGVGSSLYSLMFDIMEFGNKKEVFAKIPLPNDEAIEFHKKWGFTKKEIIKDDFEKFGKTFDVLVMEKKLNPADPNAVKPIKPYLIESEDYEKSRLKAGEFIKEI
ncbi:MAG: GNAT family N-acetyltransferase [Clostridia bacterium]